MLFDSGSSAKKSQKSTDFPIVKWMVKQYNFTQHSGLKGREVKILHGPAAVNREKSARYRSLGNREGRPILMICESENLKRNE